MLAYGAFGLGAVAAGMFLTQQHDLKFHKLRAVLSLMPPIQRLETITRRLVFAGLIFSPSGWMPGGRLPRPGVTRPTGTDPKVVWSIFMWLVYLALLDVAPDFGQWSRLFGSASPPRSPSCSSRFGVRTCSRPSIIHDKDLSRVGAKSREPRIAGRFPLPQFFILNFSLFISKT